MKQGWENKTLGDVLDVLRNGVNCKQDKKGVGDKISRIESISNADFDIDKVGFATLSKSDKEKYRLAKGDILFSHINSPIHVGKTALFNSDEEVYHGVNLLLMRPKPFLDGNYFEHFLKFIFQNGYWKGLCKQSVNQASVNQQDINKVEISFPKSLPEQQRIVAILDEAFASIAKAKANAEQNLKNAKELFESYLQGVFEHKGEGWEENILKEVCELKSGTTISPSLERTEGDVLYTKVGDMNLPDNEVEINTSSRFVNSKEIKLNQIIPEGAIIFPKRGGAIATNKKRKIVKPTIVDLNTMAIIPSKKIDNDYFFHWFQLFDLNSISNGANIPQINNYSFDDVYIPYPKSINEQQKIVEQLDVLLFETKKLETIYQQKLNDLEELKKSVLQKAFAGELKTNAVAV